MTATAARAEKASTPPSTTAASSRDRRNAVATLVVLVVTGVVIAAAAYLSNPQMATTATADGAGDFTTVNVSGAASGAAPVIGQPAPDFAAALSNGTALKLSDLRGKPVWLTFGASWCQPCRAENPDIEATHQAVGDTVTVVQVYMDEDASTVNDYAARVGIDYLTVPDPNERLAAQFRILGIPTHYFIDSAGVLRQMKIGSMDPETMKAALDNLAQ